MRRGYVQKMQLKIRHDISEQLILPLNYHHIIQSIIYGNLPGDGYSHQLHENGYTTGSRQFKLFNFSLLQGRYEIAGRKIAFRESVSWEVRSPDIYMMRKLEESIWQRGLRYGEQYFMEPELKLVDDTIETDHVLVRMLSPICVYSTDPDTKKTCFYSPEDPEFALRVNDNFMRKYIACYGVEPDSGIMIRPVAVTPRDKYVTRYKNFYVSGWMGYYRLDGRRKYLDFLYQAGIGSRNSQGFGMFEPVNEQSIR